MCRFQVKCLFLWIFIFDGILCVTAKRESFAEKKTPEKTTRTKSIRDPFNLPSKLSEKNKDHAIKLLGIVHSACSYGAVLESEGKVETVFLNDDFSGFKVIAIKPESVELKRKKIKIKLLIE